MNGARFTAAETHRAELEAAYGGGLAWEPLPGRKGARIADYHPGKIEHVENWDERIDWFITSQVRLRAAVQSVGGLPRLLSIDGPQRL